MSKKVVKCAKRTNRSYVKADFDAEAFRARHKGAQERSAAKREGRRNAIIDQIRNSDDPLETAFELLVPGSGKADTVAGEIVRAMMRIMYRDYNDGDVFYEGYGIETCSDAVAYLCDKIPELEDEFGNIAMRQLVDSYYTESIEEISQIVLDYITSNPSLITEKNTEDMFDFNGRRFIEDNGWEPEYDYDCTIPDNVYAHIEAGNISERDLEWEIESWDDVRDGDVNVSGDTVTIYGLDREAYDEIEGNMYGWLERYGDDLDEEYGVPGDEDDY